MGWFIDGSKNCVEEYTIKPNREFEGLTGVPKKRSVCNNNTDNDDGKSMSVNDIKISWSAHRDGYCRATGSYDIKMAYGRQKIIIGTARKERGGFSFQPNESCYVKPYWTKTMAELKERVRRSIIGLEN